MCQLDRVLLGAGGLNVIWLNVILGMCVRVLPDKISIWMGGLPKADCSPWCGWASANLLRVWIEHKEVEGGRSFPQPYIGLLPCLSNKPTFHFRIILNVAFSVEQHSICSHCPSYWKVSSPTSWTSLCLLTRLMLWGEDCEPRGTQPARGRAGDDGGFISASWAWDPQGQAQDW